jgi:prepilin peptidase CpaA
MSALPLLGLEIIVTFLVAYGGWVDVRTMKIPNAVSLLIVAIYPVRYLIAPETCNLLPDLAVMAGVFGGFYLFWRWAGGGFGGGDVKFMTAISFWLGSSLLNGVWGSLLFLIYMGLLGFVLSVIYLAVPKAFRALLAPFAPITVALMEKKKVFPYALAIAPAAFFVLYLQAQSWNLTP